MGQADRDERLGFDPKLAARQATELYDAGFKSEASEKNGWLITTILAKASKSQVEAIKAAYAEQFRRPMTEAIKKSMHGDWEKALLARCLDPETYYATTLHNAFKGFGTDERTVSRVLGRCNKAEIRRIAARYEKMYGDTLKRAIEKEVSGNFKKALLTMIFNEAPGQKFEYEDDEAIDAASKAAATAFESAVA